MTQLGSCGRAGGGQNSGRAVAFTVRRSVFALAQAHNIKQEPTMAHDIDRPDDSNRPRHANSVAEETSATGQRVKGAVKEELGDMIDDEEMEEKGARENAAGKD